MITFSYKSIIREGVGEEAGFYISCYNHSLYPSILLEFFNLCMYYFMIKNKDLKH